MWSTFSTYPLVCAGRLPSQWWLMARGQSGHIRMHKEGDVSLSSEVTAQILSSITKGSWLLEEANTQPQDRKQVPSQACRSSWREKDKLDFAAGHLRGRCGPIQSRSAGWAEPQ